MPTVPFASWPGGLLLLAVLLVMYGVVRSIQVFNDFKRGRALHTAQGEAIVRYEIMRHGAVIAEANKRRIQLRDFDTPLDPDHPYWREAEQAVLRG